MPTQRRYLKRPGHPLDRGGGQVARARIVLWDALQGADAPCHWCKKPLTWALDLYADHVDGDTLNDTPENLVPSCHACNVLRATGHQRRTPKPPRPAPRGPLGKLCPICGDIIIDYRRRVTCSRPCANKARTTVAPHGTAKRRRQGCDCQPCIDAERAYKRAMDKKYRAHA